ncbi:MAG: HPr family phosphocarrier protein [Clostridia bacterium]|nr:HPr family phosphocarrier protein [Clostridia bacterium]
MIRRPLAFPADIRLTRAHAATVVQTACQFESRMMIQRQQKIVNVKSTLGILSLYTDLAEPLTLLADGPDEEAAAQAVLDAVAALR